MVRQYPPLLIWNFEKTRRQIEELKKAKGGRLSNHQYSGESRHDAGPLPGSCGGGPSGSHSRIREKDPCLPGLGCRPPDRPGRQPANVPLEGAFWKHQGPRPRQAMASRDGLLGLQAAVRPAPGGVNFHSPAFEALVSATEQQAKSLGDAEQAKSVCFLARSPPAESSTGRSS